ncbi:D-tyrosyl-tRNA(Tyr) deacylase [Corynebacterium sp. zg-331]|uniref:D-aminoacyl-tRNA deacylase n=1 Tax=unclassified Corynebacterium TaxID=2624378 RepID=UPI00128CB7FA|nr:MULTISPECIES: D-aminoacyl-tRNA deacylase [unclassified Corynebacterium]MBC3185410.1 D-tyrosyl-tRNA(Tyr) deacylase [Corynebacterium sp. zg-331]MPV51905.1 D-tyrosyl-tRNA(Tyr) deacylase [Corynebacterium sp. zg331]
MKAVVSRVTRAAVLVEGEMVGALEEPGVLALVGVHREDTAQDAVAMARKIAQLRLLDGEVNAVDAAAPVLVVSQFTLQGRTSRGRRPSWAQAAPAEAAAPLIEAVVSELRAQGLRVEQGRFGAMMQVESVNDGPFTLLVDTREK